VTVRPLLCILASAAAALGLASAASAAFPGPNGRIAFTSTRDGSSTYEIYSAAPDGSDPKRLTWSPSMGLSSKQNPTWSPDGSRIAYEDSPDGRFKIYVMSSDGSGQTRVSPDAADVVDDSNPSWSPDGRQIAFSSTRPFNDAWRIWAMNADGTGLRRVTDGFGYNPMWSPDGSRIAYEADGRIQVVNADGSGAHPITSPSGLYDEGPDWSPDGSAIVFSRRTLDGSSSELYAVGADGSGLHRLTSGGTDYRPAWSPDGTRIVFQRRDAVTGNYQLFAMDADGSGVARLMESSRDDLMPDWGQSTVSPISSPPDAPMIQILSPEDGAFYVPGQGGPAIYLCDSAISFVVSCEGDVPFGEPVDTSSYGTKRFTVTATDADGRQAQKSVTYSVLDFTDPKIDIASPADGGEYLQGADVRAAFSCDDGAGGSGILLCFGDRDAGSRIDTSRAGTYTFHVLALDNAGNSSSASATYRVVAPTPPPSITVSTPAAGAVYTQGQSVLADYSCSAAEGVRLVSCEGDVPSGSPLDTSTVGARSFSVKATDSAGGKAAVSRTYTVLYDFQGFFAPIAAYPTSNTFTAGDGVPLRFSLHGNQGTSVFASGSPAWASCDSPGDTAPASGTLSYNASADRYLYLATTQKAWAGSCRDLVVTLRDGSVHRARLAFRK
jgi:Tol biopolymer transport system component